MTNENQNRNDLLKNGFLDNEIENSNKSKSRVNIDNLMAKLKREEKKDRNINIFVTCSLLSILAIVGFLVTG